MADDKEKKGQQGGQSGQGPAGWSVRTRLERSIRSGAVVNRARGNTVVNPVSSAS